MFEHNVGLVALTAEGSRRRLRRRRPGRRVLSLGVTVAVSFGLAGLPATAAWAVPSNSWSVSGRSVIWDLSADFAIAPHQANPNPDSYGNRRVWRFLSAGLDHDPAGYRRLSEFIPNRFGVEGLQGWQGDYVSTGVLDKLPHVSVNSTSANPTSIVDWPPGAVLAHPAPDRAAAIAWRSPMNGRVSIAGGLADGGIGCGDGISWWVDRGTGTLTDGAFGDGGRQAFAEGSRGPTAVADIAVQKRQILYLVISAGPNGDDCGDSTQVDLTIARRS